MKKLFLITIITIVFLPNIIFTQEKTVNHFNIGLENIEKGNLKEALNNFNRVIKNDVKNYKAYVYRGIIYDSLKSYPKAIKDFTDAIKLSPNNGESYFLRGNVYSKNKRWTEAYSDYTQAIDYKYNIPEALLFRAKLPTKSSIHSFPVNDLKRIIKDNPSTITYKKTVECAMDILRDEYSIVSFLMSDNGEYYNMKYNNNSLSINNDNTYISFFMEGEQTRYEYPKMGGIVNTMTTVPVKYNAVVCINNFYSIYAGEKALIKPIFNPIDNRLIIVYSYSHPMIGREIRLKEYINDSTSIIKNYNGIQLGEFYSPNGKSIVYGAMDKEGWTLFYNHVSINKYFDKIDTVIFSPDGNRYACGVIKNRKQTIVADGVEGVYYDGVSIPRFSNNSKHLVFGAEKNNKWFLVVDGQVQETTYDALGGIYPIYSYDGIQLSYIAKRDRKQFLVIDSKEGNKFDAISAPFFSKDGKRYAYFALIDGKGKVIIDGKEEGNYDAVGPIVFSPNSERYAYNAIINGKHYIIIDGEKSGEYDKIGGKTIFFSPNSKKIIYVAQKNGKLLSVLDGIESKAYDNIGIDSCAFSPDSKHVVFIAKRGTKWFVVRDGIEGKGYNGIGNELPIFSPDNNHIVYSALIDDFWKIIVDDNEQPSYYQAVNLLSRKVTFDTPNRFHYTAYYNENFYVKYINIK